MVRTAPEPFLGVPRRALSRAGGSVEGVFFESLATRLGLDPRSFATCLSAGDTAMRVQRDLDLASNLGINSTPVLLVNGRPLIGHLPLDVLARVIDEERASARRQDTSIR